MITRKSTHLLLHIILTVFGLIWIYPFIWMILSSFKTNNELLVSGVNPIPDDFQWENYARAWNNANFPGYFVNTVIITVATVIIVVVLSALTGYALEIGRASCRERGN